MNAQPSIIQVPLSQLRLSARNARKTGGHNIEGLAASIAAHNLLQNLTVTPGVNDAEYEVVAGGRRLAALQLLRDRGQMDPEFSVPCKVINDDDVALEASTAENTLREAMHPADQFDAFRGMVEAKKPIPDIAAHFGVSEIVVKQRLKLANVAPKLVQVYRNGDMDLEQLQALALTDDRKLQEKLWFGVKNDWQRTARDIRHAITNREVRSDSQIARFVGVDAYETAGGPVRRDLFSSRNEAFLSDRALLDKLALDKLEAVAKAERDAGWSWAEAHLSLDYEALASFPHAGVEPKRVKPTETERQRIDELEARLVDIEKLIDDDDENESLDADAREALEDECNGINTDLIELRAGHEAWPDDVMRTAGVLVYIGHNGTVVERGRLKPGQKAAADGTVTGKLKAAAKPAGKKPQLSQDMHQRLRMHREAAVRVAIADDVAGGSQLLLAAMLSQLLTDSAGNPFDLTIRNDHRAAIGSANGGSHFEDLKASPARKSIETLINALRADGMPKRGSEMQPWLATRTPQQLNHLLAIVAALAFSPTPAQLEALAKHYKIDMSRWWQPTVETYFAHVPKALVIEAIQEVQGKATMPQLASFKTYAVHAEASKALAGSGWLPKAMRGDGYKVAKPGSKPAAPAPSAVKVAKKGAGQTKKAPAKSTKKPAKKAAKATSKKAAK